jgi:uncharacterized protein with HEPN domain
MSDKTPKLYLLNMVESIRKIRMYTAGCVESTFCKNPEKVDAVLMQLIVIGENAGKLSEYGIYEKHPDVPWRKIRGLRNIIAHDYDRVDAKEVWRTVEIILAEFEDQITRVANEE